MKYITTFVVVLLMPLEAFAKRERLYPPVPYSIRMSKSFFALLPIACILGLGLYFIYLFLDKNTCVRNKLTWTLIVFALVIAGSLFAATDSLNDEMWNPAFYGGAVIALMAPISLFVLNKRFSMPIKLLLSAVSLFAFLILSVLGVMGLVHHISRNTFSW